MKFNKIVKLTSATLLVSLSIVACTTNSIEASHYTKPGFSNITDIPLPQASSIDINKSLVMGAGDTWTGHLVYNTNRSQVQAIDFTNLQMQNAGWAKVSELRGSETVITFIRGKRVATVRIINNKGYISDQTVVTIDMTNSNISHAVINTEQEHV